MMTDVQLKLLVCMPCCFIVVGIILNHLDQSRIEASLTQIETILRRVIVEDSEFTAALEKKLRQKT
jgi:hypothetical protein